MPGSAEVATFTSGIKYTGGTFQNSTDLYLNASRIKNDRDEPAESTPKQKKTGQPGSEHVVAEANKADWITKGIGLENKGSLHEAREAFKKRIIAKNQQLLCLDVEDANVLTKNELNAACEKIDLLLKPGVVC